MEKINKISAGLAIVYNESILLVHPTNGRWWNSYSLPKGGLDEDESFIDAAIRETSEEVGIKISKTLIKNLEPHSITYPIKNGTKTLTYFILHIKDLLEIDLSNTIIKKSTLPSPDEVDWAGFVPFDEAEKRVFLGIKPLINKIKNS